jgi:hypothetical protein
MALADFDAYVNALRLNRVADFQTNSITAAVLAGRTFALWRYTLPVGAVPTTSVALNKTSDNSIGPLPNATSGKLQILGGRFNTSGTSGVTLTPVDLLNISGGLDATITTEQTTNLPTAALTRHTSGEGVRIGLVIYTQVGATATTVTVRYTNQAGTPNQVSTATAFGGSGFREVGILIQIPLAEGDTGVRSVEGVTLAATTATAGNFGVCLFKPLMTYLLESTTGTLPIDAVSSGGSIGSMAEFDDDACLTFVAVTPVTQAINGALLLAEV